LARNPRTRHSSKPCYPSEEIVENLAREAEVAVNHFVEPGKRADTLRLLRLDRNLLEIYAARGRAMSAYTKRKAELGL
jgi:hypothetical protein